MVMGYMYGLMEENMREVGQMIRLMAMAHIFSQMVENL